MPGWCCDLERAAGGRVAELERAGRRGGDGRAADVVGDVAVRAARSRHLLRVVPHRVAVCAGASDTARTARRTSGLGGGNHVDRKRAEARATVERGGAVLSRSDTWHSEDLGIAWRRIGYGRRGAFGA